MSFSNAVFAGLGVGDKLTSGFANLAQTRRENTLFPLQVKSLNASIAENEAQTENLKLLADERRQTNELLQKLFFRTGGDESILDAMAATDESLQSTFGSLGGQFNTLFGGPTPAGAGFGHAMGAPRDPSAPAPEPTTLAGILEKKRTERRTLRDQKTAEREAAKAASRRSNILNVLRRQPELQDFQLETLSPEMLDQYIAELEASGQLSQILARPDPFLAPMGVRGP